TFGIHIQRHIFGITTDGAAVIKKLCRIANILYQKCLACTIHLGICDSVLQLSDDIRKTQFFESVYKESMEDEALYISNEDDLTPIEHETINLGQKNKLLHKNETDKIKQRISALRTVDFG
ncbi:MAG: hypothetical protein MHPSP_003875, partial [Paramarteilia canceri]